VEFARPSGELCIGEGGVVGAKERGGSPRKTRKRQKVRKRNRGILGGKRKRVQSADSGGRRDRRMLNQERDQEKGEGK